jgi:hypothetical protein
MFSMQRLLANFTKPLSNALLSNGKPNDAKLAMRSLAIALGWHIGEITANS